MAKVVNKPSEETIKGIVGRKIPEVLSQEEIDAVLGSGPAEDFSANDDLEDIFPDEEALALAGWVETDENRNKFLTELGLTGFMDELYGLYERYRNEEMNYGRFLINARNLFHNYPEKLKKD